MSEIKLIVGLGNPGREYERTRHNVGFMLLDLLAQRHGSQFEHFAKWEAHIAKWPNSSILLAKPQSFMNLSGRSIGKILRYFKWEPQNCLVVYDDVSLPLGRLRIREQGSAGGHNGIKSLIEHFSTDAFPRLKIGIGQAQANSMTGHVLGKFSEAEQESLQNMLATAANAVQDCLSRGLSDAANTYNTASPSTPS
jgi:peptidyl-tRNA hydrolase, PTH1 family